MESDSEYDPSYIWNCAESWDDDKWNHAYKLFLQSNPIKTLNQELRMVNDKNSWVDAGFSIYAKFSNSFDQWEGVDQRAILVVIARHRKMDWSNYDRLSDLSADQTTDLNDSDKLLINLLMIHIYH